MKIEYVINKIGEVESFQPKRITYKIMSETGLSKEEAQKIQHNVIYNLRNNYDNNDISTSTIRSLINQQLIKKGYLEEEKKSRKLGMSVAEVKNLIKNGCKDNANISYSPEMIAKYMYDSIAKEYALEDMPKHINEAYRNGYIHIHDLESYNLRSNCFQYDIRFFARNGLKIDGKGDTGSVSKPAKSLQVLLNHLLQAMQSGSIVLSGGQGIANFNTFLSPYARGLTYKEIKQLIQGFIFNCNQSLVAKGQVIFSSIGVDLSCPKVLADEPAVCPNNTIQGTYKDYQEEADLIFKAICEVTEEGDAFGQFHRFPNIIFNIRDGDLDKYEGNAKLLHELAVVRPNIYFANLTKEEKTIMGCRSLNGIRKGSDYEDSCLNTGNFMYDTINLPLLAIESISYDEFITKLDNICNIIKDDLLYRRSQVEEMIYVNHSSDFLIQKDSETGKPLYDLDRLTYAIGFNGLNEMIEIFANKNIDVNGEDVVKFLANKRDEFGEETGLRWSLIGSPAESTSGKFAKICLSKYPNETVYQGTKDRPYFTNSSHLPVNTNENISEGIKNADRYHKYCNGGNILHIFTGEAFSDPVAWFKLNQKIVKTNVHFWAYTKDFSICNDCHFSINTRIDKCPICNSTNIDQFSRVTGYMTRVNTWCDSKLQEFEDRTRYNI